MIAALVFTLSLQAPARPPSPDAVKAFEEGNAAYEKLDNQKALDAYNRAITLDSANPDYHLARCRVVARLQRHEEAITSCSRSLELRRDNAAALIERGHSYINRRSIDLALADLTRALALKSDAYALWYHLALARYLNGDFRQAADTYDNCVRKAETPENRTSCRAWQYLALVRAGRKADAQALLDGFAPEPQPPPSAYIDRLLLFKGAKTEAEIAKTMEKDAVQLPTVAHSIGMWHLLNGRQPQARQYFEKALTPPAQQTALGAVASSIELRRLTPKSKHE